MRDEVFSKEIDKKFEFDEAVASVFDDMLNRSVPFYDEVLNLTVYFALKYLKNETPGISHASKKCKNIFETHCHNKSLQHSWRNFFSFFFVLFQPIRIFI